jgi:hypothetical protein
MDLVVQLPDPAVRHLHDAAADLAAPGRSRRARGANPEVGQAALQRGDRHRHRREIEGHEGGEPRVRRLRPGDVPAAAEGHRVIVVAVGAPRQPAGGEIELTRRGVRVNARGAQGQVECSQPAFVPHALAEDAHGGGPFHDVVARREQVRAQAQFEGHVQGRAL